MPHLSTFHRGYYCVHYPSTVWTYLMNTMHSDFLKQNNALSTITFSAMYLSIPGVAWLKLQGYDFHGGDITCYYYANHGTNSIKELCFPPCLGDPRCVSVVDVTGARCCTKSKNHWQGNARKLAHVHHYEPYYGIEGKYSSSCIFVWSNKLWI